MKKLMFVLVIGLMVSMFGCDDTGDDTTPPPDKVKTVKYVISSSNGSQYAIASYIDEFGVAKSITPRLPFTKSYTVGQKYYTPAIAAINGTANTSITIEIWLDGVKDISKHCGGICAIYIEAD